MFKQNTNYINSGLSSLTNRMEPDHDQSTIFRENLLHVMTISIELPFYQSHINPLPHIGHISG